jgi:hypothetical protein
VPSEKEVLAALVDDALERDPHPDRKSILAEWREDNTSEEERRDRLTDDERAAEEREEQEREAESKRRKSDTPVKDEEPSPGDPPVKKGGK